MNDYFDGINYTLTVIAMFALLLALVTAYACHSLSKENTELRKEIARTSNHPSAVRAGFCGDCPNHEGCMLGMDCSFVKDVAAAEEAEYQQSLFDEHVDSALRLAAS